jgi:hypothetical protein
MILTDASFHRVDISAVLTFIPEAISVFRVMTNLTLAIVKLSITSKKFEHLDI